MLMGIWNSNEVLYPLVNNSRAGFARMGTQYGQYLFSDVMKRTIPAKLKVFLMLSYLSSAQRKALAEMLVDDESVRVWCWAPGWLSEDGADESNIEKTTGFKVHPLDSDENRAMATEKGVELGLPAEFTGKRARPLFAVEVRDGDEVWATYPDGSPAIVMRKRGKGADIFEGLPISLPARFLAVAAKLAGVHLFVEPETASVWSRGGYTAVQAFENGEFTLRMPDGKTTRMSLGKGECRLLKD